MVIMMMTHTMKFLHGHDVRIVVSNQMLSSFLHRHCTGGAKVTLSNHQVLAFLLNRSNSPATLVAIIETSICHRLYLRKVMWWGI